MHNTRCARCHHDRRIYARSLCKGCYQHCHNHGNLDNWPRRRRPLLDTIEEWTALRSEGQSDQQIAAQLGIGLESLLCNLRRARASGLLDKTTT